MGQSQIGVKWSIDPARRIRQYAIPGDDAGGWRVTQQTYDWKGRPLVTTNTDSTTKSASYGGCGSAGGQVVTLIDEVNRK